MTNIAIQTTPQTQQPKQNCTTCRTIGAIAGATVGALGSCFDVQDTMNSTTLDTRAARKYAKEIDTYMRASDGHALSPTIIDERLPFKEFKANFLKNQKAALVGRCALGTTGLVLAGFGLGYIADKITETIKEHKANKQ